MSEHKVVHGTFTLDREYTATPEQVFDAFASVEKKRAWAYGAPEDAHTLDFRVGGKEHVEMPGPQGGTFVYDGTYFDIVPNERIVYAYSFGFGPSTAGLTLTTIEFSGTDGGGTKLKFTEQGAYLDGFDGPKFWESGTTSLLDRLGELLESQRH